MAWITIDAHASFWRGPSMSETRFDKPEFVRRIGHDPHANGAKTEALENCPDLWELADGNFAVIGIDITAQAAGRLPPSAGCGSDERVIWIPRRLLVRAKQDIPPA